MTTALVIVKSAMRQAGLLESGETPSSDEQADGLEALNDVLDSLSASGLFVPYITRDANIAVPSAANSYSVGSGGDFNIDRPQRILAVSVTSGGSTYPVAERNVSTYNRTFVTTQNVPDFFWYNPTFATGTLYFSSKLGTGMTVTIDSLKPFTAFSLISTDISFPPGYVPALKALLALQFASEFGVEVAPSVQFRANQGLDFLRTQANMHRKQFSTVDPAINGRRNSFDIVGGS